MRTALIDLGAKNALNALTASLGLEELGYKIVRTERRYLEDFPFDPEYVYYGNVGFTVEVLRTLGFKNIPLGHVPVDLLKFAGRSIEKMTITEALRKLRDGPLFIKPDSVNQKNFTGKVFTGNQLDLLAIAHTTDDMPVLVSPVVNILSEYRCFFLHNELVAIKHYANDFTIFPNVDVINEALSLWKNEKPCAGSIDVGITDRGETIIIECHDVTSLGTYGLGPRIFGKMLEDRWAEIHKKQST